MHSGNKPPKHVQKEFSDICDDFPKPIRTWDEIQTAIAEARSGRFEGAETRLKKVLGTVGENTPANLTLASVYQTWSAKPGLGPEESLDKLTKSNECLSKALADATLDDKIRVRITREMDGNKARIQKLK
ncbi:MAG TPA: hypothetical protein ENN13_02340 [Candidatus Altiarchaeales archaeon]|nr:hypothetical protein [Candidatus Altiarchaeales archaeon]